MLLQEMSGVTFKKQGNPSLVLEPSPDLGLWILAPHIKLQQLEGQRRVNLALGSDTSLAAVSCPFSMSQRPLPPFLHLRAQTLSGAALEEVGFRVALGVEVGLNLWHTCQKGGQQCFKASTASNS